MEASELNNRLDNLICYSSQLVFVCSDKIHNQSQVIDDFLADRNDQAELALLTADEMSPLADYREELFRHLISPTLDADFQQPLNQLLAPLNNQSSPILITIFQAEKLAQKLIKELWELVLQSRFANNKQQINVLLIGHSKWADSSKAALGTKSKDQPIVLKSVSKSMPTTTDDFAELESYMQKKREALAQRIESRQNSTPKQELQPTLNKWWVKTLFGCAFLIIFAAILSWQYAENLSAFFSDSASTEEIQTKSLQKQEKSVDQSSVSTTLSSHENNDLLTHSKIESTQQTVSTKDILVTDWNTASAKLEQQSNAIAFQNVESETSSIQTTQSNAEVSLEKLDNEIELPTSLIADKIPEAKTIANSISQIPPIQAAIEPPTDSPLLSVSEILMALPTTSYAIQIAATANINSLQTYANTELLDRPVWIYKTSRSGADWFVMMLGQQYTSKEMAKTAMFDLPAFLLKNSPFVKSIAQVKQEIGNSTL